MENKVNFSELRVLPPTMEILKNHLTDKARIADIYNNKNVFIVLPTPIEADVIDGKIILNGEDFRKTIQLEFANKKAMEAKAEQELVNGDFNIGQFISDKSDKKHFDSIKIYVILKTIISNNYNNFDYHYFFGKSTEDGDCIIDHAESRSRTNHEKINFDPKITFKNVVTNGEIDKDKLKEATATDGKTTFKQIVAQTRPKQAITEENKSAPEVNANPEGGFVPPTTIPKANPSNATKKQGGREN